MRRLLLALLALLVVVPPAHAGTVTLDDTARTLTYRGDAGPNDVDVFVTLYEGVYTIRVRDFKADNSTTSPGCVIDSVGTFECERLYAPTELLYGGPGDDTIETSSSTFVPAGHLADGQEGNDEVQGGAHAETLLGGPGDDKLSSDGGPTLTTLPVGPNDVLSGGDGVDEVTYQQADGAAYSLSLDGVANDGAPGERDNIASDVENLTGARSRPSTLVGNDGPNALRGFDGADALSGGGGSDVLDGDAGNDTLDGGAGDDALTGGSEDDRLTGGPGTDAFSADYSGAFNQTIVGNDTVFARDGVKESIACGPGADTAQVDAVDVVAGDPQNACESIDRAKAAPARSPIRSSSLRVRANRIGVTLACPAGGQGCVGTVRVRRSATTIASGAYSIRAGATRTVRLRVSSRGRRALRRTRRTRVRVELRAPGSSKATATRTVTLRR